MLCGRRMRICLAITLFVQLTGVAEGVTVKQVDTFQSTMMTPITDNWTDGHAGNNVLAVANGGPNGAGDSYLQVSSGTGQAEPRLITFNQSQWKGIYPAANVGSISMELKNFGAPNTVLPIRITIRDLTGGQTVPGYSSTTAFSLKADGQWHLAEFLLNPANMTAVGSPDPLLAVLSNVQDFRLLSAAAPAIIGDAINAQIGVDDITALPNAWIGASSTSWNGAGNWTGAVPGLTTGTTNMNTATFNRNTTNSPTTIDAGRNLQNITFDTGTVNSLTVGAVAGPSLLLTAGGTIQTTSTVANAQTVNAPLVLEGNYTFTSGASSTALNFGGGITPGPTSGTTTLTLSGGNTGANTISGVLANHSAGLLALTKSGSGTWTLTGANTYSGTTAVSAGRLKFNVASGTPTIAAGATVTVAAGATLELAGSISALGAAGGNRAHITNSSTASGIVVSGTNQVVGAIDGAGTTQVNSGGALTADHIVQSALVIAGASGSLARVTIDASNASGNPLSDSLASPLGEPGAGGLNSMAADPLGAVGFISGDGSSLAPELGSPSPNDSPVGGSASSVPEPSSVLLVATGALLLVNRKRARRLARRPPFVLERAKGGERRIG